eukprot:5313184-Alexandrium_andersonii.AAC.1
MGPGERATACASRWLAFPWPFPESCWPSKATGRRLCTRSACRRGATNPSHAFFVALSVRAFFASKAEALWP